MAFAGLHLVSAFAGGLGVINGNASGRSVQGLISNIVGSETIAAPGTSTLVAPASDQYSGTPMFRVRVAADSYVAFGPTPNATTGPRIYVPANTDYDVFVKPGDKVAFILVP